MWSARHILEGRSWGAVAARTWAPAPAVQIHRDASGPEAEEGKMWTLEAQGEGKEGPEGPGVEWWASSHDITTELGRGVCFQ